MAKLVAGVDFGSDAVRVVMVQVRDGKTMAAAAAAYPRWQQKRYCDAKRNIFRQHPLDYIESLENAFSAAMAQLTAEQRQNVVGIGVDTTGSTPCPVDENGTALACLPAFSENPNAMFYLWKDHSATEEAKEVNQGLSSGDVDYTRFQGAYSSEWYWAKILHGARNDAAVKEAAYTWVEHCDWMIGLLTGTCRPKELYRNASASGHKALWHSSFSGLPSQECLASIDPYLAQVARHYGRAPQTADTAVGTISPEWAKKLGVSEDVVISGGSLDAHAGAVGAGIGKGTMVKVLGTSAVDMQVIRMDETPKQNLRPYCGMAENSILPGYVGVEAGQAAFGDIFSWFRTMLLWPLETMQFSSIDETQKENLKNELQEGLLAEWGRQLQSHMPDAKLISLDWFNGRRYPYLNEEARGAIAGLSLGSTALEIYASLVKAAIFGSRRMFECYTQHGLQIDKIIVVGGIAKKAPYVIQMLANHLQRPVMVCKAEEVCARGAAMYAAVACGAYENIENAQMVFCEDFVADFVPQQNPHDEDEYQQYLRLAKQMDPTSANDISLV